MKQRKKVISSSYTISCMHPFFDIHSHPLEMFIFRCTPSLSSITRIARLFQVEVLWPQNVSYFIMRITLMLFGAQQKKNVLGKADLEEKNKLAWK